MPLRQGKRLGPYEILGPMTAAGRGEVYRARDTGQEREVALKVLPERLTRDPEGRARLERQTQAVAALSHPNILPIHEVGTHAGVCYAVMELWEGETLRERARRSIPWRLAVEIAAAVADALAAAHPGGIFHLDLRPETLFLAADDRVGILDFGLGGPKPPSTDPERTAGAAHTQPETGLSVAGYLSPEQIRKGTLDGRSDIFSLGAVLYEMCAGDKAFHRKSAVETLAAILSEEPPSLSGLPAEIDRLIRRCLEKRPEQRFQSAEDLALALRAILESSAAAADPVPARPGRRRRWAIVAAALLLGAAAAALYYWR